MADIIIGYGNGDREYTAVFLYPIATPKQINSANVVPNPSSSLSEDLKALLVPAEITALDNGTSAFDVISFTRAQQHSNAEITDHLKAKYDIMKTEKARWYQETYRFAGSRIDR